MNRRAWRTSIALICIWSLSVASANETKEVMIIAGSTQDSEVAAATELGRILAKLYPDTQFVVASNSAVSQSNTIYVGTKSSLAKHVTEETRAKLVVPGSFAVYTKQTDDRQTGYVVGADLQGLWHGVYGLADRLGCGFYLSFDTMPEGGLGEFSFKDWELDDRPLVPVRMVFNWHNFLSGCSTWELKHWNKWTDQAHKMGYNAVMVHAYGNNPMAGFNFKGMDKPVGYLSSTRVGRDWATNHVNDVRRLFGGEVFDEPVFGCEAAIEGTDAERTKAAHHLMAQVFSHAERQSVDVYFAVDVDTHSANPQELITLLPEQARFDIGDFWLARPDTPEGYDFYKAQVKTLLDVYPQVDSLVVWHRTGRTPWMEFSFEKMPQSWQEEFDAECKKTPEAKTLWHSHHLFAISKIVRAFQRAVDELGRSDVKIAFGSWNFAFLPASDRFMPDDVTLIPLDWLVLRDQSIFDTAERRASVAKVAAHRPVIPIAWAHHDDGNYVGRPYTPYRNFYDLLVEMKCDNAGYGIIHWTTKPLDLYFSSLVNQCWARSQNESLDIACRQMAADCVAEAQAEPFGRYLNDWVTTIPKIGRETLDFFIDHELKDLPAVEAGYRRRMAVLDALDEKKLSKAGHDWVRYFKGLEQCILDIYRTEDAFNRAVRQYRASDLAAARSTIAECKPEEVIERFARFSQHGGMTRGERGLVVSMNTRWLSHYVRLRQQLGVQPVRLNFSRTSHDLLAQSRGIFTFHFDQEQNMWETLGAEETGCQVFALPDEATVVPADDVSDAEAEVCRTGIASETPIELAVTPIMRRDGRRARYPGAANLPTGCYRLTLLMLERQAEVEGQNAYEVKVSASSGGGICRVEPVKAKYLRLVCRGNSINLWNSIREVRCDALLRKASSVTASGHKEEYEAPKAADGDASTRWAVEGREAWIQFGLDPNKTFDQIAIDWYEGDRREYDFKMRVSDDGDEWTELPYQSVRRPVATDQIDIARQAGGHNRVLKRSYEVRLDAPGTVNVTLTPTKGKASLCGLVLEPVKP